MKKKMLHNRVLCAMTAITVLSCARLGEDKIWDNPFDPGGVNWHPPRVQAPRDTNVAINDTVRLVAVGQDDNGTVVKYLWSFDRGVTWNLHGTPDHPALHVWGSDRVGEQRVWVRACDNDGILSAPDSFTVRVHSYRPVVTAMNDTIVSQRAIVAIRVMASDTNGPIVRYLWRTALDGKWSDSTTEPVYSFSRPEGGGMSVVWAARDRDGQLACDTFTILFNRGPSSVALLPKDGDTATFASFDFISVTGTVRLRITGIDPDSTADTLSYTLFFGSTSGLLPKVWSGRESDVVVRELLPNTRYFWTVRAHDLFGDSVESSGSFWAPKSPSGPRGMTLIRSKGKTFFMGLPDGEAYERPLHEVSFGYHFWIDTVEVTRGEYGSVMSMALRDDMLPMTGVTWYDAVLYCNARSKRDGLDTVYTYSAVAGTAGTGRVLEGLAWKPDASGYRLPTEAEWEYACRANSQENYFWGQDQQGIDQYAWYRENSAGVLRPVAGKKANAFGLYDMSGNAWEWCNDWFCAEYYASSPALDPAGPENGQERVLRGGSYANSGYFAQSGARSKVMPSRADPTIGFRVVLPHP